MYGEMILNVEKAVSGATLRSVMELHAVRLSVVCWTLRRADVRTELLGLTDGNQHRLFPHFTGNFYHETAFI